MGFLKLLGRLGDLEQLAPSAEPPFFFNQVGRTFPASGPRRYRVAFMAGCIANVAFARLNEATVRVLQKNGCDVFVPRAQVCCGAIHFHAGASQPAREFADKNLAAFDFRELDAVIVNVAGCGAMLKDYGHHWHDDRQSESLGRIDQALRRQA